ncbi:MAG: NADH:flavin oxidoreductase/NADH oxidase [Tardiphaga sp.]|jgi:2,4-dienoyl-CoA reductase-like NADH-dependent reductase (Old Yellow Enzyme family)|nr:NADH:flavin oxidoreductase/NADH oxidase [Tardiphaga sp.]
MTQPQLFSPFTLRGVTAKNRIVVSPMCQYSAIDGVANDWHLVHLGKFAQGGAGIVMVEATAVAENGRITHGDVGLWQDGQTAPLKRIADFIRDQGSVPAIQLAHAGRKASMQRPWYGNAALTDADKARGDMPWQVVAPSPIPMDDGWLTPQEMTDTDMATLRDQWRLATLRAAEAGYEMLEVHCAHGYLLHEFLSPLSNKRTDSYGGDRAGRMRYPLDIIETVRAVWPDNLPLSVRISSVDGVAGGIEIEDSLAFVREAKARGADVIDCSSGGLMGSATAARIPRGYSFQVPYAEAIRTQAEIPTMAVGLILHPQQAEEVIAKGQADLVAIGREVLFDPNWPLHARLSLNESNGDVFADWPKQYGWWLERREPGLRKLDGPALPFRR